MFVCMCGMQRAFNECVLNVSPLTPAEDCYAVTTANELLLVQNSSARSSQAAERHLDGEQSGRPYALQWIENQRSLLVAGRGVDVYHLDE